MKKFIATYFFLNSNTYFQNDFKPRDETQISWILSLKSSIFLNLKSPDVFKP